MRFLALLLLFPFGLLAAEPELPPDPGSAGKESVSGIDANRNGLRDDIERYIMRTYDSPRVQLALKSQAHALQEALASASTASAGRAGRLLDRSTTCIDYLFSDEAAQYESDLFDRVVNTKERKAAYTQYQAWMSAQPITRPEQRDAGDACDFDLKKITD